MKQIIILVETQKQADKVLKVLNRAEENGRLDFSFGCRVNDVSLDVTASLDEPYKTEARKALSKAGAS